MTTMMAPQPHEMQAPYEGQTQMAAQATNAQLYRYQDEYLASTWIYSATQPDGIEQQLGSVNTMSDFWQFLQTVTLNHLPLGARLQLCMQGFKTGWGVGGRFEIRTHDYEKVWAAVCQAGVTGQLDYAKAVYAADTTIAAESAIVNVWVNEMQGLDLAAVRDALAQLTGCWGEYVPNAPQTPAEVHADPMQHGAAALEQQPQLQVLTPSASEVYPSLIVSPTQTAIVRPPLPPMQLAPNQHLLAPPSQPIQPIQPTQPISAGRARGHKKSRSAPQTVSQAFLNQHYAQENAKTAAATDLSMTVGGCKESEQQPAKTRDQISPGFVCRGVLYPPGLTRKQRRSIQFQGLKGHEESEPVEGWVVGLHEADGPVSAETFERLRQRAEVAKARKESEERARRAALEAEEDDDDDELWGGDRTRSACYLSDDDNISTLEEDNDNDNDSESGEPVLASFRSSRSNSGPRGLRRVESSPMLRSPMISTLSSLSRSSSPQKRNAAPPSAASWCDDESDDDYEC